MPLTLPPISRRRFLAGTLAAGAGMLRGGLPSARGDAPPPPAADPHRFALLSDTHIAADTTHVTNGINMFDHLKRAVEQINALEIRPAAAIVNGDLAWLRGQAKDYAAFMDSVRPLREAGLPLHLALGNHDNRERFWDAFPADAKEARPVEARQILTFSSPRANFFVLDSLDRTNETPGVLGEKQIAWLATALDAAAAKEPGKPLIVFTHHHPDAHPDPKPPKAIGLVDAEALLAVLLPRKQVKAYFFGHTHRWGVSEREGLHLVNLPATSYVFEAGRPSGWVDMKLAEGGADLELRRVDADAPKQPERVELRWR